MASSKMDLSFTNPGLEQDFLDAQASRSQHADKQFHYARALTWLVVLLRAAASGNLKLVGLMALGVATALLPALLELLPRRVHLRWRLPAEVADSMLQVALACFTHQQILTPAARHGHPSGLQMTATLLSGNGVAWLLFSSLWSSLPFRYALVQQAALAILLLVYNTHLCQHNADVQLAYSSLQLGAAARARALLGRLWAAPLWQQWQGALRAGRSCAAAVLASPVNAREAVRAACMHAASETAAGPATVEHELSAGHGAELCKLYQPASLLLLGFLLPMLHTWVSELRRRRQFLEQRAARAAPGEAHRLRAMLRHLPGLPDFCMFAVPAVAAMYTFVAAAS